MTSEGQASELGLPSIVTALVQSANETDVTINKMLGLNWNFVEE